MKILEQIRNKPADFKKKFVWITSIFLTLVIVALWLFAAEKISYFQNKQVADATSSAGAVPSASWSDVKNSTSALFGNVQKTISDIKTVVGSAVATGTPKK